MYKVLVGSCQRFSDRMIKKSDLKMAATGHPIQIFKVVQGVPQFDLVEFNAILSLVGHRPVSIISVNGGTRSGKSFLLNFFLNHHRMRTDSDHSSAVSCFAWRDERERTTVGIWMWSEPFLTVDQSGREIGVLLLDTQGSFDPRTDFRFNALIFCISIWLSSVFVYNTKSELSEDKLQFLEYFVSFATDFDCGDESRSIFQKCVILIRDWQNAQDNQYGIHRRRPLVAAGSDENDWIYEPAVDNFLQQMLVSAEGFCEEAVETRHAVLKSFSDVSCCLLPHPGREVATCPSGSLDYCCMDEEFRIGIGRLVDFILDADFLEPRRLNGTELTGNSLRPIVAKWAELVYGERLPEARQLKTASAGIQLQMLLHRVQKAFDMKLEGILNLNLGKDRFQAAYAELTDMCLNSYKSRCVKFAAQENKLNLAQQLENYMVEQSRHCLAIVDLMREKDDLAKKVAEFKLEHQKYCENASVVELHLLEQKVSLEKIVHDKSKAAEAELAKSNIKDLEKSVVELKRKNDYLEEKLARRTADIQNQLKDFALLLKLGRNEFKRIGGVSEEYYADNRNKSKCVLL